MQNILHAHPDFPHQKSDYMHSEYLLFGCINLYNQRAGIKSVEARFHQMKTKLYHLPRINEMNRFTCLCLSVSKQSEISQSNKLLLIPQ